MNTHEQYNEALAAYRAGRYEEAITLLAPLAEDTASAMGLLVRFYLARSHYRLAVRRYRGKSFREAAGHFQAAARINPASGGIAGYLADHHAQARDYPTAIGLYESRLQKNPADTRTRVRLALAQWKSGRPYDAQSVIQEGLRIASDCADLHYYLGVIRASEQRLDEAEESFNQALAYDRNHARALERLAQCSAATGRHERAAAYLERAHRADPHDARIAWQFALLSARNDACALRAAWPEGEPREHPEAIEQLSDIITAEPDFIEAFLDLPASEVDAEVFSALAATFDRALQDHPEYADLQYHCSRVYSRLGLEAEAIRHAEQAVAINPRYVNALILLGRLYGRTDQNAAAVERLRQAIEAGADYPDVHHFLGTLYEEEGKKEQARVAYQRALEQNADNVDARRGLARIAC